MAASTAFQPGSGSGDKADFANYAPGFVNRFRRLPGARSLAIGSALGAVAATIIGPFETGHFTFFERALFWTLSIATVALAWRTWFALFVRSPLDWIRATLIGGLAITTAMPLVVASALKIVGHQVAPQWWLIWPKSLALAMVIGGGLWFFTRRHHSPGLPIMQGRLWRHGVTDPRELLRVEAEDHYLRLIVADGRNLLVHDRFSNVLAELGHLDGCLVRRGRWVASGHVASIERDGRRINILLRDGHILCASPSGRQAMRQRGWI